MQDGMKHVEIDKYTKKQTYYEKMCHKLALFTITSYPYYKEG
jgi:hypothetical protein